MDFSRFKPVHEGRVLLLALAAGLPAVVTAMVIYVVAGDYSSKVQWTLTVVIIGALVGIRGCRPGARRVSAADAGESA